MVVMEEAMTEVVAVVDVEVGLVKKEVEMGLFKNLVVFGLGFSDIPARVLVSRIRTIYWSKTLLINTFDCMSFLKLICYCESLLAYIRVGEGIHSTLLIEKLP